MNSECQHIETQARRRTKSNGIIVVTVQCVSCGKAFGEKPKHQFVLQTLADYDEGLQDAYWLQRQPALQAERIAASEAWWANYAEYLQSPHWKGVRSIVLTRDRICQVCFSEPSMQAHHLSYESFKRWGISFAVECVGVCKPCHEKLHHGTA